MAKKKVIAAMSGGVDSSVAAAVYKQMGYDVIGVTLRLKAGIQYGEDGCASVEDEEHAQQIAQKLGIPHLFLDFSEDFIDNVLKPCWHEYACGRTPNPCTLCNPRIKFGKLIEYAQQIGAEAVVTGHYANIDEEDGIFKLRRGDDPLKDQTYFLFGLTQQQLSMIRFPLGTMTKAEVRELAQQLKLQNFDKKDSQDTCFQVPGESFQESLRKMFNAAAAHGRFITVDGKVVGTHSGIHQYTIGQRKGLGVALGKPAYVAAIDNSSGNVVVTTDNADLMTNHFVVAQTNWQTGDIPQEPFEAMIQVRYRSRAVPGKVIPQADGKVAVELQAPLRAVTPGQAAVFYANQHLIGGGYIENN